MKTPQARATTVDLQPVSRRTDRHFNMKGDMMALMYSDVTANKGEAARALAATIMTALAGVEEILSLPARTHAMKKRDPRLRCKGNTDFRSPAYYGCTLASGS